MDIPKARVEPVTSGLPKLADVTHFLRRAFEQFDDVLAAMLGQNVVSVMGVAEEVT